MKQIVRSSCRGCHGVCQVLVHTEEGRVTKVTGDPESPTSRGYICPKGQAAPELLYHPDRITTPLRRSGERGQNRWTPISWEEALGEMAEKFGRIRQESGPEFLAVAQGTGRPYTEFTIRFANAFGTPNFVGPGHVCYLPRVMASGMTLGRLPVADIYGFGGEAPACILIWGCNITHSGAADGMCGGMLERAIKKAQKVIVIDPRRIGPAEKADYWLRIRPGTDAALALAMIHVVLRENLFNRDFVENYTFGFDKLIEHVNPFTPEWASSITRIPAETIQSVARAYATTAPACMQWGNGVDMNSCNFQTARALLILSAITGNVDRPGGDALWVPPEGIKPKSVFINPDQAGKHFMPPESRERMLTAGMFPLWAETPHAPSFWRSQVSGAPYRVKAMWIVGSNPLLTQTQSLQIEAALKDHIEFTVVSDFFLTPTAQLADLVLPAATWLEQDDVVSLHKIWCVIARRKVAQVGESRDDRHVILELARRLGLKEAFPWENWSNYIDWLLEDSGMNFDEFCQRSIVVGKMRYHKYRTDGFQTPTGKFEIYSTIVEHIGASPLPVYREPAYSPVSRPDLALDYPLILVSGSKNRYFFHSELHQIASLRRNNPDPIVEIHPKTAEPLGISDGDWVCVESPYGSVQMRARLFDGIAPDVVYAQHAWWYPEDKPPEYGWKRSSVNLLFGNDGYDPETGSEPMKCYLCRITKSE